MKLNFHHSAIASLLLGVSGIAAPGHAALENAPSIVTSNGLSGDPTPQQQDGAHVTEVVESSITTSLASMLDESVQSSKNTRAHGTNTDYSSYLWGDAIDGGIKDNGEAETVSLTDSRRQGPVAASLIDGGKGSLMSHHEGGISVHDSDKKKRNLLSSDEYYFIHPGNNYKLCLANLGSGPGSANIKLRLCSDFYTEKDKILWRLQNYDGTIMAKDMEDQNLCVTMDPLDTTREQLASYQCNHQMYIRFQSFEVKPDVIDLGGKITAMGTYASGKVFAKDDCSADETGVILRNEADVEDGCDIFTTTMFQSSHWQGYKFIHPSSNSNVCLAGLELRLCSEFSAKKDKILWRHDDLSGQIIAKDLEDENLCLFENKDADTTLSFKDCDTAGPSFNEWERTANGQIQSVATGRVIAKEDCSVDVTSLILLDETDVKDGCDLFTLIGPHEHEPLDFGSVLFHQVGQDLTPAENDESFGSSVSIGDEGAVVAVGGSVEYGNDEYIGTVTMYSISGHSWTEKATYQLSSHPSPIKPKVTVTVSGDAKRVAIAVASTNDQDDVVQLFDYDAEDTPPSLTLLMGRFWESSGGLHGLKLSMDETGDTLVVGLPAYNNNNSNGIENSGRIDIFNKDLDENDYNLVHSFHGINNDDRFGSAVSICSAGDFIAYGATGRYANRGTVGVLKLDANEGWRRDSNLIYGEYNNDESGFSVKVVRVANKIRLAMGSIFNDGNNQVNSGHVRVYECGVDACYRWTQVGRDIDGDNGVIFEGDAFHVGDAFGFSLDMSDDGETLLIGAPFHSASRASDYYSGSVKLFGFNSDTDDWEQLGHDLVGDTRFETSGYSVGMSRNAKTIVVGSPADTKGSAQIYLQDEVSNMPSIAPSAAPSSEPTTTSKPSVSIAPSEKPSTSAAPSISIEPSAAPSSSSKPSLSSSPSAEPSTSAAPSVSSSPSALPSNVPSLSPTSLPSDIPSSKPSVSIAPSEKPSTSAVPSISIEPSAAPSLSSKPSLSSSPSAGPSTSAAPSVSSSPSALPSISSLPSITSLPSDHPSQSSVPSIIPSQKPSSVVGRSFQIRSNYERFDKVLQSDETFCIQSSTRTPSDTSSKLNMRPCDGSPNQKWLHNADGQIVLKDTDFAIYFQGKKLELKGLGYAQRFDIDRDEHYIAATRSNNVKMYIGIDASKIFSRLRLFREGDDNESVSSWYIDYDGPSDSPTMTPTHSAIPTLSEV